MNIGMQDAMSLGPRLARVCRDEGLVSLLDDYEDERIPVARRVLLGTRIATWVVTRSHTGGVWDRMLGRVLRSEAFQRRLLRSLSLTREAEPDAARVLSAPGVYPER